jgi:uncharacterized membrane protein YgdD (TMEM256/DUF423 family)
VERFMNTPKTPIPMIAALFGFVGVAAGAFGAHGVDSAQAKAWMDTGSKFQLAHVMATLACVSFSNWGAPVAMRGAPFFLGGIVLFSGSLYALAFGVPKIVAMMAPLGGLSFMVGWAILAFAGWKLWRQQT